MQSGGSWSCEEQPLGQAAGGQSGRGEPQAEEHAQGIQARPGGPPGCREELVPSGPWPTPVLPGSCVLDVTAPGWRLGKVWKHLPVLVGNVEAWDMAWAALFFPRGLPFHGDLPSLHSQICSCLSKLSKQLWKALAWVGIRVGEAQE